MQPQPGVGQFGQPAPVDQFGQPQQAGQFGQPQQAAQFPAAQGAVVAGQPAVMMADPMLGGMMIPATSAGAALAFSIIGLICCWPLAVVGIIMGAMAMKVTGAHPNHPDTGKAKAALIVGIIGVILGIILTILNLSGALEF